MDELLRDFLVETTESLDSVDVQLVQFEREPQNQTILRNVFRLVHSIKGTCEFIGLSRLESLTHAAETLIGQFRDGAPVTPEAVGVVLAVVDRIKTILAALDADGREPEGGDLDLIDDLIRLASPAPPAEPARIEAEPARHADEPPEPRPDRDAAGPAKSIRVNIDTLERQLNLVSELVLSRNQLLDLARTRGDHGLTAPLQRLSLVTAELQLCVMQTRMQPIGQAWQKLPRLVRDLSIDLRKDVQLVTRGADTELDRQVLDLVRDPLTHLVRNALDHGVEHPEERIMAGKPPRATITLSAFHSAGAITIEVADDGRGLDIPRIRAKALKNGLASDADLARMGDGLLAKLIFHPGFSTADRITAISGRGVGLDVVQTNIELVGGAIDVRSSPNEGAVFALRLPLTLAIVPALLVRVAGQRFALPQAAVIELVRISRDGDARLERVEEARMLRLRGQLLPLVDLAGLLGLAGAGEARVGSLVTVLATGSRRYAVMVDSVMHTEEIVVKPMATQLRGIAVYSGNTILGDGSVVLILEPNGLARTAGVSEETERAWRIEDEVADASGQPAALRLLLFRAGGTLAAAPLSAISRLEDIERAVIERVGGRLAMQYRGRLLPLCDLGEDAGQGPRPCLVVTWETASVGLLVDEILEVVEEPVEISAELARPGFVGSAIIAGRTTEILDVIHFLAAATPAARHASADGARKRLLLVEPSAFFRDLIAPALRAAGFEVTVAEDASQGLARAGEGTTPLTLIVAGDLPDMGLADFVERARAAAAGRLADLVVLAGDAGAREAAAVAGPGRVVSKFDRDGLLALLARGGAALARAA